MADFRFNQNKDPKKMTTQGSRGDIFEKFDLQSTKVLIIFLHLFHIFYEIRFWDNTRAGFG